MTLLAPRLRGFVNAVRRRPVRFLAAWAFLALVCGAILVGTRRAVRFLDGYPQIGTIADAVAQRSLEALFLVLMVAVAFSVLTTAVGTLYASEELPLLLTLPIAPERVFALKVAEVFASSALLPAALTLPVLVGLGLERAAPAAYYPAALLALVALYALPVALGSVAALVLVRVAPAGRVTEVATAANVVLAAGLVAGLRALRPERLTALSPEEFEGVLAGFARLDAGAWPPAWASRATWAALDGRLDASLSVLAACAVGSLVLVSRLAAHAYRVGWIRVLDTGRARRDARRRGAAWWERPLARWGAPGALLVKDVRLGLRDPRQWSQLLVLLALAGVYLVSTASLEVPGQRFRDALGTLNLAFLSFLLVGVGVRVAYPLVSNEGEGSWMLLTAPARARAWVLAKFAQALAPMLALGLGVGLTASALLDLSPTLAWASPLAAVSAALAASSLGVGLGAAWPRFDIDDPAQVPLSAGGMVYMGLGLLHATLLTTLLAWPAWRALRAPSQLAWTEQAGLLVLALVAVLTAVTTVLPLVFGCRRLARWEANG